MKKVKPETCKSGGVFPPPCRVECALPPSGRVERILKAKSSGVKSSMKVRLKTCKHPLDLLRSDPFGDSVGLGSRMDEIRDSGSVHFSPTLIPRDPLRGRIPEKHRGMLSGLIRHLKLRINTSGNTSV
jgi:hypothetical protein